MLQRLERSALVHDAEDLREVLAVRRDGLRVGFRRAAVALPELRAGRDRVLRLAQQELVNARNHLRGEIARARERQRAGQRRGRVSKRHEECEQRERRNETGAHDPSVAGETRLTSAPDASHLLASPLWREAVGPLLLRAGVEKPLGCKKLRCTADHLPCKRGKRAIDAGRSGPSLCRSSPKTHPTLRLPRSAG